MFVNSICGGDGLCGKCRVIVREGEVKSKPTALLDRDEIRVGYILACETQVLGNLKIEVPEETRLTGKPSFGEEAAPPTTYTLPRESVTTSRACSHMEPPG